MSSSENATFAIDILESLSNQLDHLSLSSRNANSSRAISTSTSDRSRSVNVDLDSILDFDFLQLSKKNSRSSHAKNANNLPDVQTLQSSLDQLIREKARLLESNVQSKQETSDLAEADLIPLARIIYSTLSLTLETLLNQAEQVQDRAFYWTKIEDSSRNTLAYLIQTLPPRLYSLLKASVSLTTQTTRSSLSQTSGSLSTNSRFPKLDKETLRKILDLLRDSPLFVVGSLFPEAIPPDNQRVSEPTGTSETAASLDRNEETNARTKIENGAAGKHQGGGSSFLLPGLPILRFPNADSFSFFKMSPMRLTRHEARTKRSKVLKKRDELAEMLGAIAMVAATFDQDEARTTTAVSDASIDVSSGNFAFEKRLENLRRDLKIKLERMDKVLQFLPNPTTELKVASKQDVDVHGLSTAELTMKLQKILGSTLPQQTAALRSAFVPSPIGLSPPSYLVRIWPNLVLIPLGSVVALRLILSNWQTVLESLDSAKETVSGFFKNWLYEPVLGLIHTVRTGTEEEGMIVSRESLQSDLESLQRMVIDFGVERNGLNINGAEVDELKRKVKEGDLSSVMKVYEGEMKSPVSSLIKGGLLRSLLIQIQKSKVDIELAMSGIDRLLKSQQLLFAAVGIAPAMFILWGAKNGVSRLIWGKIERSGEEKRMAWEAMRRIDRLLTSPSTSPSLSAKSYGLLLLDISLLRRIALPLLRSHPSLNKLGGKDAKRVAKRLRELWIEDLKELESVAGESEQTAGRRAGVEKVGLGAGDGGGVGMGYFKRRAAVERMWNSWGSVLTL